MDGTVSIPLIAAALDSPQHAQPDWLIIFAALLSKMGSARLQMTAFAVSVSEFKAHCLNVIRQVRKTRRRSILSFVAGLRPDAHVGGFFFILVGGSMCGRYVPPDEAAIERFWHIGRHNWRFAGRRTFNAAPTTEVPIVVRCEDGTIELRGARWGLIPAWWKKDVPPHLTFNARSEEAAVKPMWRQSLRTHRCLMPARGWYEWNEREKVRDASGRLVKQPYFISCPNAEVVAFAALWASWVSPAAEPIDSCALLTRAAAPGIAAIHDRMPAVLSPEQFAQWLDPATKPETFSELISHTRHDFEAYAIGTAVNNTRNDYPELLQRVA